MQDLLEVLNKITELLYQEKSNEAYGLLIKCLPIMAEYIGAIEDVEVQCEVMNSLTEAVTAMEENDYTLLADILQYDVIEKLENIN